MLAAVLSMMDGTTRENFILGVDVDVDFKGSELRQGQLDVRVRVRACVALWKLAIKMEQTKTKVVPVRCRFGEMMGARSYVSRMEYMFFNGFFPCGERMRRHREICSHFN